MLNYFAQSIDVKVTNEARVAHPEPLPDVPLEQLAPLQRHVLETLWDGGPGTVYDLRDRLADGESVPYTSVLSALQKLEKFGWVTHESRTQNRVRQYVYAAAGDRGCPRAPSASCSA